MGKFIVIDNQVIMGNHEYHNEMIPRSMREAKIKPIGGGRWHWDTDNDIVYLYGASLDFGYVTVEQFKTAFDNSMISPFMDDSEILFSSKIKLEDAMTDVEAVVIQVGTNKSE